MKIKVKTLYNIGDEVVVPCKSKPGYYRVTKIRNIEVTVNNDSDISFKYYTQLGEYYREDEIETRDEFNERQRAQGRSYDSYLKWLGKQDYIGD